MATAIVPDIYPSPPPILHHATPLTSGIGTKAPAEIIGYLENIWPHRPGQLHKGVNLYGAAC